MVILNKSGGVFILKKTITATRVGGRNIVAINYGAKNYLPPITCKQTVARTDFALLGKAIVGNLGFSELGTELNNIKVHKSKFASR